MPFIALVPAPAFPALLVTLEGLDGSGKSTQATLLVERLRALGADPLAVREPGGTPLSERVRALLLDPAGAVTPRAELLLFAAARAQLVEEAIRPALAAGRPVVCDRFYDSSTAYQGAGRGLADPSWMAGFHAFVTGGLVPHRTYVVDVPPEVAATRRAGKGTPGTDRMEAAGEAFFARVRAAYLALAEAEPDRVVVLDGRAPPEAVHAALWADLEVVARAVAAGTAPRPPG